MRGAASCAGDCRTAAAARDAVSGEVFMHFQISLSQIKSAEQRMRPFVRKTALTQAHKQPFSKTRLFFKWENEQRTGSFKIRGALNKILSLSEKERSKGLITASAGNHAQGAAFAARAAKAEIRVVMMREASKIKVQAVRDLGAKIILKGKTYDESFAHALSIQKKLSFYSSVCRSLCPSRAGGDRFGNCTTADADRFRDSFCRRRRLNFRPCGGDPEPYSLL